jgi:hypothetical protein
MPYLNLDDGFADHEKVDALTDGAFRLHVSGMNYCARKLTDGVVPKHRVHRLMPTYKPAYLRELIDAEMWLKHPEGYEIHDYLDWNKPRAWWEERREAETTRKAEYRARKDAERAQLEAAVEKGLRSV